MSVEIKANIETKYNIGDTVYRISTDSESRIHYFAMECKIVDITVEVSLIGGVIDLIYVYERLSGCKGRGGAREGLLYSNFSEAQKEADAITEDILKRLGGRVLD